MFIFILSFRLTVLIYPSMFLLFYMSTDVPVHHYTCSVYFFFFGITCTMTFHLLGYLPTDPPKNKFTCLPSCFSFAKEQRLTCHHNYLCTCPYMYLFMTLPPEGRPGISDVPLLPGISGLSFDFPFLSPLLFFLPSPLALSVLSFFC